MYLLKSTHNEVVKEKFCKCILFIYFFGFIKFSKYIIVMHSFQNKLELLNVNYKSNMLRYFQFYIHIINYFFIYNTILSGRRAVKISQFLLLSSRRYFLI